MSMLTTDSIGVLIFWVFITVDLESETFVKLQQDRTYLRECNHDEHKVLYQPVLNPYTECDSYQSNNYRA